MQKPAWNFKAIFLGFAADFLSSQVFGIAVTIPLAAALAARGLNAQQIEREITVLPAALVFLFLIGLMSTVIGGFVAAHIAQRDEMKHAAGTGALSTLSAALVILALQQFPLWYNALSLLLVMPCALLGGYICAKRPRNEDGKPTHPPIPEP